MPRFVWILLAIEGYSVMASALVMIAVLLTGRTINRIGIGGLVNLCQLQLFGIEWTLGLWPFGFSFGIKNELAAPREVDGNNSPVHSRVSRLLLTLQLLGPLSTLIIGATLLMASEDLLLLRIGMIGVLFGMLDLCPLWYSTGFRAIAAWIPPLRRRFLESLPPDSWLWMTLLIQLLASACIFLEFTLLDVGLSAQRIDGYLLQIHEWLTER